MDERRRGTSDEERREVPACRASFCHVAYMRTCRKGVEKRTHLYGVLIMRMICTHLDVVGGWTLLRCVCMHVHEECWAGTYLYWTLVSITIGTNNVRVSMSLRGAGSTSPPSSRPNDAWLPLSAVLIVAVCAVSSRCLDVDSLDGTAKGDGETDDDANATCGRGAGIMVVVVFVRKALSTKNRGIR